MVGKTSSIRGTASRRAVIDDEIEDEVDEYRPEASARLDGMIEVHELDYFQHGDEEWDESVLED